METENKQEERSSDVGYYIGKLTSESISARMVACEKCGRWKRDEGHICPAKWKVWYEGDSESVAFEMNGYYPESVAIEFAERTDCERHLIDCDEVVIVKSESGKMRRFAVSAKTVIEYDAEEYIKRKPARF